MPYVDTDDGHRIALQKDVLSHARQIFETGLQLEALLLSHEYIEQRLNSLYKQVVPAERTENIYRKYKQIIDLLKSLDILVNTDYQILNEFNRLRNVNSNQILNFSLRLHGAKKGDMEKAMNLAENSIVIVEKLVMKLAGSKAENLKEGGSTAKNSNKQRQTRYPGN